MNKSIIFFIATIFAMPVFAIDLADYEGCYETQEFNGHKAKYKDFQSKIYFVDNKGPFFKDKITGEPISFHKFEIYSGLYEYSGRDPVYYWSAAFNDRGTTTVTESSYEYSFAGEIIFTEEDGYANEKNNEIMTKTKIEVISKKKIRLTTVASLPRLTDYALVASAVLKKANCKE